MAYFDDFKKKRMTKQDHMREDARKNDEGADYRGGRKNGAHMDMYRKDERGGYHGAHSNDKKNYGDRKGFGDKKPNGARRYSERYPDEHRGAPSRRPAATVRPDAPRPVTPPRPAVPAPAVEEAMENLLTGRNPIREALKSGRDIEKLMVAKGDLSGTAREIVAMAHEAHVPVQMVERIRLDELARNHQGMIAFASAYQYADVDDMLALARERHEDPFLIILDGVTDPHNLGAVIRTAAAVGAHGVIVPERRAVGLTPAAVKASAGGIEHIKVARVTNLTSEIKRLQSKGIWLYGADAEGENFRSVDFSGPCALVIGSEGDGISRLVLEQCDHIVSIPMKNPEMESLNASVAAGILMYAAAAARE